MASMLHRLFTIANLASMLAMMTNMYLAISFGLRYLGWKTNKKALVCNVLIWIFSFVVTIVSSIPLFDINLGDAGVPEYKLQIFEQAKPFVVSFLALFLILGAVVCFLTTREIKKKKKERAELNLPPTQAEARLKMDIKAIKTIAITVAAYFLCYGPTIVYAMFGLQEETQPDSGLGLIVWYSLFISSAVNPTIYYLRTSRCRSAFKQFLKDPFGSSDFKEKPNGRDDGEKQHTAMARKGNGRRVESGEEFKVERDGNQMRQAYLSKPSHGMVISSIEDLQAEFHSHQRVGYEENGKSQPSLQVKNSGQGGEEKIEEGNDEVPKKCGLEKEPRKLRPCSSRNKVHPLGVAEAGRTGEQKEEQHELDNDCPGGNQRTIQESSGKDSNGITTGRKFERVAKTAWIN
ncbi:hypothetical protein ACROYT_G027632 [Oculina patagonica]